MHLAGSQKCILPPAFRQLHCVISGRAVLRRKFLGRACRTLRRACRDSLACTHSCSSMFGLCRIQASGLMVLAEASLESRKGSSAPHACRRPGMQAKTPQGRHVHQGRFPGLALRAESGEKPRPIHPGIPSALPPRTTFANVVASAQEGARGHGTRTAPCGEQHCCRQSGTVRVGSFPLCSDSQHRSRFPWRLRTDRNCERGIRTICDYHHHHHHHHYYCYYYYHHYDYYYYYYYCYYDHYYYYYYYHYYYYYYYCYYYFLFICPRVVSPSTLPVEGKRKEKIPFLVRRLLLLLLLLLLFPFHLPPGCLTINPPCRGQTKRKNTISSTTTTTTTTTATTISFSFAPGLSHHQPSL